MKLTAAQARKMGIAVPKTPRKRTQAKKALKPDQGAFDTLCIIHGVPLPAYEYHFHPTRRWRFDFAWKCRVAAECVGGVWLRGHHSRGQSQIDDMERRNEAQLLGWIILEFTPQQFNDGSAFAVIKRALEMRS